jgi:hypothetical protein
VWEEEEKFGESGGRDYICVEERRLLSLLLKRYEKGMFRLKCSGNTAQCMCFDLTPWHGGICSPNERDTATAKIMVDKMRQVAKQQNVKTIKAGVAFGQVPMFVECGFQQDKQHLRVVLHVA